MAIFYLPLCDQADCATMYMCISCTCTQPMMGLELVRTCGLTANGANGSCCVACHDLLYILAILCQVLSQIIDQPTTN